MLVFRSAPLSAQGRWWRSLGLGIATAPVLGAFVYNHGHRIPWICPIRHFTGIPCPTCGLTRSFMAMAQGDWSQAAAHHLLGPILFLISCWAIVHLAVEVFSRRRVNAVYLQWLQHRPCQLSALAVLLTYHSYRLYGLFQTGELQQAIRQAPLAQFLTLGG